MIFICYFTAWFVAARKLRSLVDNGFGFVQASLVLGLAITTLVQCVASLEIFRLACHRSTQKLELCRYTWADAKMYEAHLPEDRDDFVAWNASTTSGLGRPDLYNWLCVLWLPVGLLVANDIRMMKRFNRLLELPPDKNFHFFICHHQSSGGNQARILFDQLAGLGCSVWYDNAVAPGQRNLDGMRRGVRESVTLLIFLSGREHHLSAPSSPPSSASESVDVDRQGD